MLITSNTNDTIHSINITVFIADVIPVIKDMQFIKNVAAEIHAIVHATI